jgi:hypothetical protein
MGYFLTGPYVAGVGRVAPDFAWVMENFQAVAEPWWVNLLILVPVFAYLRWRRTGLNLGGRQLLVITLFATAFGFVESAVVVYLRAAAGLLPGYQGTLADIQHSALAYQPERSLAVFPQSLLTVEAYREAATMIMLITLALAAAPKARERVAVFLWTFAVWDIAYYGGLWTTTRWPGSLKDVDVLFLIPVPWVAQVWFPILVSGLTLLAVAGAARRSTLEK